MDKSHWFLMMKTEIDINIIMRSLYIISLLALIISVLAAIMFLYRGLWGWFSVTVVSAILDLVSLMFLMSWEFGLGGMADEDDIPFSFSDILRIIIIVIVLVFAVFLFIYALSWYKIGMKHIIF